MSAQVLGPRKHRLAERQTGLTFDRVLRLSNYTWEGRTLTENGHTHTRIDTATWATEPQGDHHWTSCRELAS